MGVVSDASFYELSAHLVHRHMADGDPFDRHDSGRVAFPVVWSASSASKL